ncbi:hypothetical protein [Streptomyces sp. Caat 7-52]|uniref:hypothetical protein n=1 Tax=Streptomyces sp. Caat 7-52 TaxID=2949637 RepID=UPI002034D053|nr:hypothetical protein [Streptomyces sp. Caat 7-52]
MLDRHFHHLQPPTRRKQNQSQNPTKHYQGLSDESGTGAPTPAAMTRFNAQVVNWTQMHDCYGDVDRVPALLDQVELEDDTETWEELGYRLALENDLVFPAGFAALPRLLRLASRSAPARGLAGTILRRAAGHHGCDELLADCADAIAEFRKLLDRHLQSRPVDYLATFLDSLAAMEEYHWSAVLGDFTDDFYHLACPSCAVEVTIAVGDHGRNSAIRDWNLDDVERRGLRPASFEELSGIGRWMHETAVRDGQEALADGIAHLFGRAEFPHSASVFSIADEYTSANRPVLG